MLVLWMVWLFPRVVLEIGYDLLLLLWPPLQLYVSAGPGTWNMSLFEALHRIETQAGQDERLCLLSDVSEIPK